MVFERGKTYHRRTDLHDRFGGNWQSGITPCAKYPYVFLFTAPAGEQYGYQDTWLSTTQFSYTGEGQVGDMEMARGNRAIQRHAADGRQLHLFEKTDQSGYYRYLGQFRYVSHQVRRGSDVNGGERSQIVFILELVEPATPADGEQAESGAAADPASSSDCG
jgi:5-methylcytosine-specific restriction protein A